MEKIIKQIRCQYNEYLDIYRFLRKQYHLYKNKTLMFEHELPPEFIITDHADKQMDSRFKWSKDTKRKVIVKAWSSEEKLSQQFHTRKKKLGYTNCIYKLFSGYVFVFGTRYNKLLGYSQKILITAINPKLIEKNYVKHSRNFQSN